MKVPYFSFEIAFTPQVNFSDDFRKLMAPFVKMCKRVTHENKYGGNEKIELEFENGEVLFVTWNALVCTCHTDHQKQLERHSIMDSVFFPIWDKISDLDTVLNETGHRMHVVVVENDSAKKKIEEKQHVKDLMMKLLVDAKDDLFSQNTDFGITLQNDENPRSEIMFGPYLGTKDLARRNIPFSKVTLEDYNELGLIAEIKVMDRSNKINFKAFQEQYKRVEKIREDLWKAFNK